MRRSRVRDGNQTRQTWSFVLAAIAVSAASISASITMAAPRIIRVEGPLLAGPVVLSKWSENEDLVLAMFDVADVPPGRFTGRSCLKFSFFWGTKWNEYVDAGRPVSELRADEAEQHGCFYPAVGNEQAVFVFAADDKGPHGNSARIRGLTRWVGQPALDVLSKHGIPIRVDR